MMAYSHIDNYLGEWEDERGNRLDIKKVNDETAVVSFFAAPDSQPLRRHWYREEPSVNMVAEYRPEDGPELVVELWEKGAGFRLYLTFEAAYVLDQARRDALVPGLSRHEEDDFLDQYYRLFEPLKHYTRRTAKHGAAPEGAKASPSNRE